MTPSKLRTAAGPIEPLENRIAPAVALVDLGALDGTDGFKVSGLADDDSTGLAVSAAGDINGDGRPDFIVAAPEADLPGKANAGKVFVVFGSATAFGANFDLTTLTGANGFSISGEAANDLAGQTVSAAGDVNGDGISDLLIGAPGHNPGSAVGAGAAYIVYGKRTAFAANLDLSSPTVTKIAGAAAGDLFGSSVSAAGDVNRDGRADIIVGAPGAAAFTGASYVIFGRSNLGASVNLANLTGANGFKINGEAVDDNFGNAVSGAGDVNRDGFADVIVGAYSASTNGNDASGAAYVVFGKASGFTANLALASLTGANGFKINGELADDFAGWSVTGAGDMNGDGFADVVIGARTADRDALADSGSAYVVFGRASGFTATLNLSSLNGSNGFEIPGQEGGAELGGAVSRAGDLNRDGFADILIGADAANPNGDAGAGSAYAIFGKRDGFTATFSLGLLNGINGFRINGDVAGDSAGHAVAAAGDIDRDGFADLLVGAPRLSGAAGPGAAYVVYGTELPVKISADGRTAVLTDTDGDKIVVRVSKGRLGQDDFTLGLNDRGLLRLNLSDDGAEFQGASVSISATIPIGGTGNGTVNVGAIDATGIDLLNVAVRGDLGQIDAGDANPATTGLAKLSVRSLGAVGGTQPIGTVDPLLTGIEGRLGSFASSGDVLGVVEVNGSIGAAVIGGDLDGSAGGTAAGLLRASGSIGNVTVTGGIIGGADDSGLIAGFKLGRVSIGADLTSANAAKPVSIFGGGLPLPTNPLDPVLAIASLSVKGSVLNARVLADTDVTHSLDDSNAAIGNIAVRGTWTDSLLHSTGNIGNVTVLGNFTGTDELGITAGRRLGALTFGGDVQSLNSGTPLLIIAVGDLDSTTAAGHLALPAITVRGDVTNTWFLAGYGQVVGNTIGAVNRDASIGTVIVDGAWKGSNLIAGVNDSPSDGFGRNDVAITSFDQPGLIGRIAVVVIRGAVTNNGIGGSHFGISAEQIGAASITGVKLALTSTAGQSFDLGATGDVKLVEV